MTGTLAPTTLSDTDWSQDPRFDTVIHRRKTRSVRVGDIWIGSGHPVVVQSMINEDTLDVEGATCLLYTSPSPRDLSTSRMPSSA